MKINLVSRRSMFLSLSIVMSNMAYLIEQLSKCEDKDLIENSYLIQWYLDNSSCQFTHFEIAYKKFASDNEIDSKPSS